MYSIEITIVTMQLMLSAYLYPLQSLTPLGEIQLHKMLFRIFRQTGPPATTTSFKFNAGGIV